MWNFPRGTVTILDLEQAAVERAAFGRPLNPTSHRPTPERPMPELRRTDFPPQKCSV